MIENNLSFNELSRVLKPVLALDNYTKFIEAIEDVFDIEIKTINDIYDYMNKFRVLYEGYRFHIRNLQKNKDGHIYIELHFRIETKWWYDLISPDKKVISALKKISVKGINNLKFAEFERSIFIRNRHETKLHKFKYHYDSLAFNYPKTDDGITISPLLIGISKNEDYRFVEFFFNASCYFKGDTKVVLREDWLKII